MTNAYLKKSKVYLGLQSHSGELLEKVKRQYLDKKIVRNVLEPI